VPDDGDLIGTGGLPGDGDRTGTGGLPVVGDFPREVGGLPGRERLGTGLLRPELGLQLEFICLGVVGRLFTGASAPERLSTSFSDEMYPAAVPCGATA